MFWAILAVLCIAAGAALWQRAAGERGATGLVNAQPAMSVRSAPTEMGEGGMSGGIAGAAGESSAFARAGGSGGSLIGPVQTVRIGTYEVGPGRIDVQSDGSLMMDNRFRVRGKGTEADPYEITWELLKSVSETFQPLLGMNHVPKRLDVLNGTVVRITGFVVLNDTSDRVDEFLLTFSQWDSCCIGLPPTPFDSIEVRLASPQTLRIEKHTFATVTGVLQIEPSLLGERFLLGLYMMNRAELVVLGSR